MQRASLAVLLAIALVAGITAGTIVNRSEAVVPYSSVTGSDETAIAFYRALNQALAGAGTDALAALLAPGFLDHDASIGETQTAEVFLDRIRTLGQTPGAAQLAVESIDVSGSNLIVHLSRAEVGPRLVAALTINQVWEQPAFEVLRVARGRIIDRWSSGLHRLEATAFDEIVLYAPPLAHVGTSLVRVDIPAGVVHQWHAASSGFLLVESGSARMGVIHLNESEETYELDQGASVLLEAGDRVQLRSVDSEPVMALMYALQRRGATEGPEATLPVSALHAHSEGVTQSMLWSGVLPQTEAGTVHRVGSMVLLPGEEVRLTAPASATLLVAIDSGTLDISAPQSTIEILGDDFWPADHADMARIDADGAAWVTPKGEFTLRNTAKDPTRVLLVTVDTAPRRGGGRLRE